MTDKSSVQTETCNTQGLKMEVLMQPPTIFKDARGIPLSSSGGFPSSFEEVEEGDYRLPFHKGKLNYYKQDSLVVRMLRIEDQLLTGVVAELACPFKPELSLNKSEYVREAIRFALMHKMIPFKVSYDGYNRSDQIFLNVRIFYALEQLLNKAAASFGISQSQYVRCAILFAIVKRMNPRQYRNI